jgi:hypothetical protein
MGASWGSMALFVAALMTPAMGRAEPPRTPPRSADPGSERGLVLAPANAATRLAVATPAMDFARRRYARRIALSIGIDDYAVKAWRPLRAAVADARHMAALFRAMGFDRVITLENSTRQEIVDALEQELPLDVSERDLVVVFFAGHGATAGREGFIVARDTDRDVARTGISVTRLKDSAWRMRARHVAFLMDACFSGRMLRRAEAAQVNHLAYWQAAAKDRVVQILTAGSANELVQERGGWGVFTRAVHTGLGGEADRNRDGVVTAEELALNADARVRRDSQGRQHPQWGTVEGSGTALFLDMRRVPRTARSAAPLKRPVVPGLEQPLARVHEAMARRDWAQAEKLVRDLMVAHADVELRLLLAEVYVEADVLANASLIEAELAGAARSPLITREEQQRVLDLRARLDKALREAP